MENQLDEAIKSFEKIVSFMGSNGGKKERYEKHLNTIKKAINKSNENKLFDEQSNLF